MRNDKPVVQADFQNFRQNSASQNKGQIYSTFQIKNSSQKCKKKLSDYIFSPSHLNKRLANIGHTVRLKYKVQFQLGTNVVGTQQKISKLYTPLLYNQFRLFFLTIFGKTLQLGIGRWQNSLSFLSKFSSFISKSLSFSLDPRVFSQKPLSFINRVVFLAGTLSFIPVFSVFPSILWV